MHHSVTCNFGSAKVCLPAIFETSFSYDKDTWIAAMIITCTFFFLLDVIFST